MNCTISLKTSQWLNLNDTQGFPCKAFALGSPIPTLSPSAPFLSVPLHCPSLWLGTLGSHVPRQVTQDTTLSSKQHPSKVPASCQHLNSLHALTHPELMFQAPFIQPCSLQIFMHAQVHICTVRHMHVCARVRSTLFCTLLCLLFCIHIY